MRWADIERLSSGLDGVRFTHHDGVRAWRLSGRLIARQTGPRSIVIRCPFAQRSRLIRDHPRTFSIPRHFARHMMIAADLTQADHAAIERALEHAWQLQSQV